MSTKLASRRDAPQRPGGVWDYISPSRLNLWLKCPLAFRLKYIDGLVTPTSPSQFVGKVVHRVLETYYRERMTGSLLALSWITCDLAAGWEQAAQEAGVTFDDQAHEAACLAQAVGLVAVYLDQVPSFEVLPLAVEVSAEAPLIDPDTGENMGIPLLGITDLVLDEPDGPLIIDFKTAARGGEFLEVTHEVQLSSYSYLFRHGMSRLEGGLEIRSLIKTKVPRVESHRYARRTSGHFGRLFAVIRAYLDDLDRGRFVFRPGLTCGGCDFHEVQCPAWKGA